MAESIVLGPNATRQLAALLRKGGSVPGEVGPHVIEDAQFPGISILEGVLDGHLLPASVDGGTETTATLSVYRGQGDTWGDKQQDITVTNRSAGFFAAANTLIQVVRINGEWRPLCPFSVFVGTTDAAVTAADAVDVTPHDGAVAGSLDATLETVEGYDRYADIDEGSWVHCIGHRWGFEIIQAECPA